MCVRDIRRYVFANLPTMGLPPLVLDDADRERLTSDLRRMAAAVPRRLVGEPAVPVPDLSRVREAAAADARRRLHGLIPEEARTCCSVDMAVVEGRAYREILRHATEQ